MYGSIFDKLREWVSKKSKFLNDLLGCPLCTGFWVGIILTILIPSYAPFNIFEGNIPESIIKLLFGASFTSGAVFMVFKLEEYLGI